MGPIQQTTPASASTLDSGRTEMLGETFGQRAPSWASGLAARAGHAQLQCQLRQMRAPPQCGVSAQGRPLVLWTRTGRRERAVSPTQRFPQNLLQTHSAPPALCAVLRPSGGHAGGGRLS